jgi:hypothetical protein
MRKASAQGGTSQTTVNPATVNAKAQAEWRSCVNAVREIIRHMSAKPG